MSRYSVLFFSVKAHLYIISTSLLFSPINSRTIYDPNTLNEKRSGGQICHGSLGCFIGMNIFGIDEYPHTPEDISLQIKLYTRQNPFKPQIFPYSNITNLFDSPFNVSKDTKMIIHGFGGSCDKPWLMDLKTALLNQDDVNIFCADWRKGALHPYYSQASANTQIVGKMLSIFIELINSAFGDINDRLHLIGFSLGAHICGFVGSDLKTLHRITGLDPAGPIFRKLTYAKKLDPNDANFVDVIHSNGKGLLSGGLGSFEPSGHVDIYPNGGREQLGCPDFIGAQLSNMFRWLTGNKIKDRTCNHRRAAEVFIESLESSSCEFRAFPCSDWMSFYAGECFNITSSISIGTYDPSLTLHNQTLSSYYLSTRSTMPYCGRQLRISVNFDSEYGSESLYKGSLSIIFVNEELNQEEAFMILKRFYAPGTEGKVVALPWNATYDNIYIQYNQRGFGLLINLIKSRRYLKVNGVTITDGHTGASTSWILNNTNCIIESGFREKLIRTNDDETS